MLEPKAYGTEECRKAVRFMFKELNELRDPDLAKEWGLFLKKSGQRISENFVCDLVKEKARTGIMQERNKWESFQANFTIPMHSVTLTTSQACVITTRVGQTQTPSKDFPASVVVWNGNGIRARWLAARNELKSLVHRLKPDLLCFLEAKVNSEKLLALQGFEEWANEEGFVKMFCHWSTHNSKIAYGTEGILILTKIPCEATYGIGDPELDAQARVVTLEFPKFFILISYNPQGGVREESLNFRNRWEKAFTNFLRGLRNKANQGNKGVIWGGDFNVNPLPSDWTIRAFDQIRHRIPKGEKPAGCRTEDQNSYREMLGAVGGINLGEFFGNRKRTCFPNEQGLDQILDKELII